MSGANYGLIKKTKSDKNMRDVVQCKSPGAQVKFFQMKTRSALSLFMEKKKSA